MKLLAKSALRASAADQAKSARYLLRVTLRGLLEET
jgi:hypothetical protein